MRIELYYHYRKGPEWSYEANVAPQVGDIVGIVDAENHLTSYEVVRVMHWVTAQPDVTLTLDSVQLLVEGDPFLGDHLSKKQEE